MYNYRHSFQPETGEIVEFTDSASIVVGYTRDQADADAQIDACDAQAEEVAHSSPA